MAHLGNSVVNGSLKIVGDATSNNAIVNDLAVINPSTGSNYNEGLRINRHKSSALTSLCLCGANGSVGGTTDGQWWLGAVASQRKLYITHNGSTGGGTYFYASSSSDQNAKLHLGASGTITSGNADAVTGGAVFAVTNGLTFSLVT